MKIRSINNTKKIASNYKKALKEIVNLLKLGEEKYNIKLEFFKSYMDYLENEGILSKEVLTYLGFQTKLNIPYLKELSFLTKDDVEGFAFLYGLTSERYCSFKEVCDFADRIKFDTHELYNKDSILDDICEVLSKGNETRYTTSLVSSKFILKGFEIEPPINFRVLDYPDEEFYDPKSLFNFVLKRGEEGLARIYHDGGSKNYLENPTLFEETIRKCIFDAYEKHPEMVVNFG